VSAAEAVDAAFVYTFARYDLPHHPYLDLDRASAGVVKVLDGQSGAIRTGATVGACRQGSTDLSLGSPSFS
jgi:hypothetical protein